MHIEVGTSLHSHAWILTGVAGSMVPCFHFQWAFGCILCDFRSSPASTGKQSRSQKDKEIIFLSPLWDISDTTVLPWIKKAPNQTDTLWRSGPLNRWVGLIAPGVTSIWSLCGLWRLSTLLPSPSFRCKNTSSGRASMWGGFSVEFFSYLAWGQKKSRIGMGFCNIPVLV